MLHALVRSALVLTVEDLVKVASTSLVCFSPPYWLLADKVDLLYDVFYLLSILLEAFLFKDELLHLHLHFHLFLHLFLDIISLLCLSRLLILKEVWNLNQALLIHTFASGGQHLML